MMAKPNPASEIECGDDKIQSYKVLLANFIDKRPSGTRQRLADALGKHRSFVTQITSASYATPLPAKHVATVFALCHLSEIEQQQFLDAYHQAHPGRLPKSEVGKRLRHLSLLVPDLGNEERNKLFDQTITDIAHRMGALALGKN